MAKQIALNLGCGNDYRESNDEIIWINADKGNCKKDWNVDIEFIVPLERMEEFDRIDAVQVLEHVEKSNFPNIISNLYVLSKPNAIWNIVVPHGFSDNFITDPTHKMPFSTRTFDYFIDGTQLRENGVIYGWGDIKLQHEVPPFIDGNQSIHFKLKVIK